MGNMGSSTSNFKLFWCSHDIWLADVFCGVEVVLFLKEMFLGSVDYFWGMLAEKI